MKDLENAVRMEAVGVQVYHNCGILDVETPNLEGSSRRWNVTRKEGWTYYEPKVDCPENFCVTLHEGCSNRAITITAQDGGPGNQKVIIKDVCELFQYYCSGTGRTIGIGVNIAPGWKVIGGDMYSVILPNSAV